MSCLRRHGLRDDPRCVLVNQISGVNVQSAPVRRFGYCRPISELCYSTDRTVESYRQLHPGHACSCQIASVDRGRAQHRFECLDLCESELQKQRFILVISRLSVIGQNVIVVLRDTNGVFTRPRKYPHVKWQKRSSNYSRHTFHPSNGNTPATRTRLSTPV